MSKNLQEVKEESTVSKRMLGRKQQGKSPGESMPRVSEEQQTGQLGRFSD